MGEQAKKAHISAGLLAHVCANRGEPRKPLLIVLLAAAQAAIKDGRN